MTNPGSELEAVHVLAVRRVGDKGIVLTINRKNFALGNAQWQVIIEQFISENGIADDAPVEVPFG